MSQNVDELPQIRSQFHAIANKLNSITIKTGQYLYTDRIKDAKSLAPEVLEKEIKEVLLNLEAIEKSAIESGEALHKMKEKIYKALGYEF